MGSLGGEGYTTARTLRKEKKGGGGALSFPLGRKPVCSMERKGGGSSSQKKKVKSRK